MTDDARRDRVAEAIRDAFHQGGELFVRFSSKASRPFDDIADAAIAAYNEPEPEPQLLIHMAQAIARADRSVDPNGALLQLEVDRARAALGVVVRKLASGHRYQPGTLLPPALSRDLDIPESLVIELLDE